jgi:CheY-like chemotaxis protein
MLTHFTVLWQSAADLEEEMTGPGASRKHKAPAAPPSPAQSEPRALPAQPGRGLHVLLVDDDGKSRQMMARYLTILGYKVRRCRRLLVVYRLG